MKQQTFRLPQKIMKEISKKRYIPPQMKSKKITETQEILTISYSPIFGARCELVTIQWTETINYII